MQIADLVLPLEEARGPASEIRQLVEELLALLQALFSNQIREDGRIRLHDLRRQYKNIIADPIQHHAEYTS